MNHPLLRSAAGTLLALALGACTAGPMRMYQRYYLGAQNGVDHVYYRVTVEGHTELGVAEFRDGWFPAQAVDALFGDVSMEGMPEALAVEEKLREQVDGALVQAHAAYLAAVLEPEPKPETIEKRIDAVARVQQFPAEGRNALPESRVLAYDPARNLVAEHSGDKLVMVLSSNPDEVIGKLTELVEDAQTEKLFSQLAGVMAAREHGRDLELLAERGASERVDRLLLSVIAALHEHLGDAQVAGDRERVLGQLDALAAYLKEIER